MTVSEPAPEPDDIIRDDNDQFHDESVPEDYVHINYENGCEYDHIMLNRENTCSL